LLQEFRPELVWATFGNTSNLSLAQWIARRAGCPWVVDVKDNWSAFVPAGLRRHMAWRFRDAAGVTANARHHLDIAQSWLRFKRATVVYSGVADAFFEARNENSPQSDKREILMIGSTYHEDRLLNFMATLRDWLAGLQPEERSGIRFVYAGSDVDRVRAAISRAGLGCEAELCGQLPIGGLAQRAGEALANCYLWAPFTFHHKLLELLVTGRPVLAFPGEHAESRELAAQCTTPFFACNNPDQLKAALQQAWATRGEEKLRGELAPPWRWDEFSEGLEAYFMELTAGGETPCAG
jgi:IS1 family transposase